MPSLNKYVYEPLGAQDAMRLIILHPAKTEEAPLSCSIIQRRLSTQAQNYHAVSYAWGQHRFSSTLKIRCKDGSSRSLRITPNVDALLRCLRASNERARYWWIDAICLDQENDREKAERIPAMGSIFSKAQQVYIWLGSGEEVTLEIFIWFREVGRLPPDLDPAAMKRIILSRSPFKLFKTDMSDEARLAEFFNRPWFSRRWVIQEACLAREAIVHCGRFSLPLSLLSLAATRIQKTTLASYSTKMISNLCSAVAKLSILELLWNFHEAICLDPKDRVAALFGLVSEENRFHLDYSLHWTELYVQIAASAFGSDNNDVGLQVLLHLFEFGQVSQKDNISYPSWVPDWRKSRRRPLPYSSQVRSTDTYESYPISPGQSEKATLTFQHNTLQIRWNVSTGGPRGRPVVFAKTFGQLPEDPDNAGYKPPRVVNLLQELFPPLSSSMDDIVTLSRLLQTIVLFRNNTEDWRLHSKAFERYIKTVQEMLPGSSGGGTLMYLRTLDVLLQDYCLLELERFNESGRSFGIGPKTANAGDVVIPLWRLGWGSSQMVTMLVVRPSKAYSTSTLSEGEGSIPKGRVLGPTVCILSGSQTEDEPGQLSSIKRDPGSCSMYLI